jgi:4-amino-4-deoxy-L-arabinose transferase-like glycosyltransferase
VIPFLIGFVAARILGGGRPWLWIVLGGIAGVGLLNKYSMGFFALALAIGVLLVPAWRQLARKEPWIGAALTVVLFIPHVAWAIAHGVPTLECMHNATLHQQLRRGRCNRFLRPQTRAAESDQRPQQLLVLGTASTQRRDCPDHRLAARGRRTGLR